jgi:hypothetical protein
MTKTELRKQFLKFIFDEIKSKYNVSIDFEDIEGHGYFTFAIYADDYEYFFDLSRNYYDVIPHKVKNQVGYAINKALAEEIEDLIKGYLLNSEYSFLMPKR